MESARYRNLAVGILSSLVLCLGLMQAEKPPSLEGTVTDLQGIPVPGVKVIARHSTTQVL